MITIVDYGLGNLGSIQNMLRKIGSKSIITSDLDKIEQASKLILPGVGAFDTGMKNLVNLGLTELLNKKVLIEKVPILGVCLGIQLMTSSSEEGSEIGLGWFDAKTVNFNFNGIGGKFVLPNMGWQEVSFKKESPLFEGLSQNSRFYFVHRYHLQADKLNDVSITAKYGYEYVVGLEHDHILGVQFHPEKSHKFGMKLYHNFVHNY
jgi:glutamine amidotransferase